MDTRACWICHGGDGEGPDGAEQLASGFCDCRGSLGEMHARCLKSLIDHRGQTSCATCKVPYTVVERLVDGAPPRPSSRVGRAWLVLRHWLLPASLALLLLAAEAAVRLVAAPVAVGLLYHRLADGAALDTAPAHHTLPLVVRSWVIGGVATAAWRLALRAWITFIEFFASPIETAVE